MFNDLRYKFARFMQGRYGTDNLNRALSVICVIAIILDMFIHSGILWYITLALLIWMYFRTFSKNISARYKENQKWLQVETKIRSFFTNFKWNITHLGQKAADYRAQRERNKGYHIYKCPRCSQKIRIPKGKGHIMVHCPKCGFEFHKKS